MQTDKQKLEILLKRKEKAESLPEAELLKYKSAYDAICKEIAELKKKLGLDMWNLESALNMLMDTNRWLNLNLKWDNWQDINTFLEENPAFKTLINTAELEVNTAFVLESMDTLKEKLEAYKEAWIRLNKAHREIKQEGFREVLPYEEGYENPFKNREVN